MMRTFVISAAAVALFAVGSLAQNADIDLDYDDDDVVTLEEFEEGRADIQLFKLFGRDEDGVITEDEVYAETFRQYDRDRDEAWSTEEFMSSIRGADEISQ